MLWTWISFGNNFALRTTFPISPEQQSSFDDCPSPTPCHLHDLHHIAALQLTMGEGLSTAEFTTVISRQQDLYSIDLMSFLIHQLQSSMMTNEESTLPKLTQCCLLTLPNWSIWDAAHDKHLDAHHTADAFLKPIP